MRLNLPVTQHNYDYPADGCWFPPPTSRARSPTATALFSASAVLISAELLGQPHSLIRHPDVPAAAFKDLWRTIPPGPAVDGLGKKPPQKWRSLLGGPTSRPSCKTANHANTCRCAPNPRRKKLTRPKPCTPPCARAAAQGRSHVDIVQGRVYATGWRGKLQRALEWGMQARLLAWLLALLASAVLPRHGAGKGLPHWACELVYL